MTSSARTTAAELASIEDARKRVTAVTVRWVLGHLRDLKPRDLAELLEVGESTVKRWKKGKTRPNDEHFRRIRRLIELKDLLQELYGEDEKDLGEWMYTRSELLDRKMPHDYLKEEGELEPVLRQLSSLVTGAST